MASPANTHANLAVVCVAYDADSSTGSIIIPQYVSSLRSSILPVLRRYLAILPYFSPVQKIYPSVVPYINPQ
jgi:hypothetical protein